MTICFKYGSDRTVVLGDPVKIQICMACCCVGEDIAGLLYVSRLSFVDNKCVAQRALSTDTASIIVQTSSIVMVCVPTAASDMAYIV